ncbi:MAG: hypothetical protein JNJ80_14185 [Gemmatimonadetes bacterium]|nr:hypothetical protein [Gemmatimonadota bacterium]MCC7133646.1 hypothetical protein [Gemmatimonadales bacterium]
MQRKAALAGSIGLLLVALAHAVGHFAPAPTDPAFQTAWRAMAEVSLSLGFGWLPSLVDVWNSQSLTMLVLVAALGLINLRVARAGAGAELARTVFAVTALATGALAAVNVVSRVGMPAASFAVVAGLFAVAAARARE